MSENTKPDASRILHLTATSGNAKIVKELLADHVPVSFINSDGNSALHAAFINKHYIVVDLILEAIHSTSKFENLQNPMGLTHLHIACTRKREEVIQGFLDYGANVEDTIDRNSPLWAGFNAMHFAACFQSLQAMKVLLKAGMNQDYRTAAGKTALGLIRERIDDALIMEDLLEDKKLTTQRRNFSNFQIACLNEDKGLVQKFIDHGAAKMNSRTSHELSIASLSSPLHCAVASHCKEKVELLLQNGAKVECINYKNVTPLHLALYEQSIVYKTASGGTVYQRYDHEIAQVLYAAVEDKMVSHEDSNGLSFFHAAIANNDLPTVEKYLKEGKADVNKQLSGNAGRFSNYSPLHMAVLFKRPEIAELLINNGADVNAIDKQHRTPLLMALNYGYQEFIELLLMSGAMVDIVTANQKTMLHFIVQLINCSSHLANNEESQLKLNKESFFMYIEQMVKLGVNVNAKDDNGDTALHYFSSMSDHWAPYFQMLLDFGADINLKNNENKLPFNSTEWRNKHLKNKVNAIFYHHVQKLKALGLKVDPKNDETCKLIVENGDCFDSEDLVCREQQRAEEIARLKNIKIGDATLLYNFIKLEPKRTTLYAGCKILKKIAEDEDLKKKFPSYGYLIQLKYRAAIGCYGSTAAKRLYNDADGETSNKRQCF